MRRPTRVALPFFCEKKQWLKIFFSMREIFFSRRHYFLCDKPVIDFCEKTFWSALGRLSVLLGKAFFLREVLLREGRPSAVRRKNPSDLLCECSVKRLSCPSGHLIVHLLRRPVGILWKILFFPFKKNHLYFKVTSRTLCKRNYREIIVIYRKHLNSDEMLLGDFFNFFLETSVKGRNATFKRPTPIKVGHVWMVEHWQDLWR